MSVTDWIFNKLADRLGVAPPSPGEELSHHIRLEQPWPQWLYVFTIVGAAALIAWLYRNEGRASGFSKFVLAGLRILLVVMAVFMLSEAVLSVQRTGLPNLTIIVDDSASSAIADPYEKPEEREALQALADSAAPPAPRSGPARASPGRIGPGGRDAAGDRQGPHSEGPRQLLRRLEEQYRVRIYHVSTSAQPLSDVGRPGDVEPAAAKVRAARGDRRPDQAGRRRAPGPDGAPRRAALGDRAAERRPDHRGRVADQGRRARGPQGRATFHRRPRQPGAGPRPRAHRAPGRRRRVRR